MQDKTNRRARRGSGSIAVRGDTYYGLWRIDGKRVQRKLGPVRKPRTSEGLTQTMAEARLRELMTEVAAPPVPVKERYTIEDVGTRHIAQLRTAGRRPNTLESYESYLRVHLSPCFESKAIAGIRADDIEGFIEEELEAGQAPKSVRNYLGLLHGIFEFALKKRWVGSNPCKLVEPPADPEKDDEIHFLDLTELNALIRAAPDDELGRMEAALYLTAAMTGLRQGELLALRWTDVDWLARKIRVRRSLSRGKLGRTKSRKSLRGVPLADRVGTALERHYQRSAFQADDDLVFCHPHTGNPYDRSKLLKRFKAALRDAGVREVRFHDLRHTFGTTMAANPRVSMRTLQEWMGHDDIKTTLIYADYAPAAGEAELVDESFGSNLGSKVRSTQRNSTPQNPRKHWADN